MKNIFLITGSRADYGVMKILIKRFNKKRGFKLVLTGSHLLSAYGNTIKEIRNDGVKIDYKIKIKNSSDSAHQISKATGEGIKKFAFLFNQKRPDIIIVLGDRYEILSAVIAAYFSKIPVAHIGGGDTTLGVIDEGIRHSISKMSWLHFTNDQKGKKRLLQLGEDPKNIFNTGSLGIESIKNVKLVPQALIEKKLNFKFKKKNILVTFHPVTLENNSSKKHMAHILSALKNLKDTQIIFTYPNNDINGREIIKMINKFVKNKKNAAAFPSLGQTLYISILKRVDCILGNSSSGIFEAPTLKIPTINIGDRQKGRLFTKSIINCKANKKQILNSIKKIYSNGFRKKIKSVKNYYEKNNTSMKIYNIIIKAKLPNFIKKEFKTYE